MRLETNRIPPSSRNLQNSYVPQENHVFLLGSGGGGGQEETIELASIRALGNLRKFFKYTNKAWTLFRSKDKERVEKEDMTEAIIKVDRAEIGRLDTTSLDILWNCTVARKNKGVLSMATNAHRSTVTNRLNDELATLTRQSREGKEVKVSSIYREIPDGVKILEEILKDLGQYKEVT